MIRDSRKKVDGVVQAIRDFEIAKERLQESVLTTKQVAEIKGVTLAAVHRWVQKGDLVPAGIIPEFGNLFDPEDIARFSPPPRGYHGRRSVREAKASTN